MDQWHPIGEPQIVGLGWPTENFGDDMLDLHRRTDNIRGGQTVPAALASLRRYPRSQGF